MQEGERGDGVTGGGIVPLGLSREREADFMGFQTRFHADNVQSFGKGSRNSVLHSGQSSQNMTHMQLTYLLITRLFFRRRLTNYIIDKIENFYYLITKEDRCIWCEKKKNNGQVFQCRLE